MTYLELCRRAARACGMTASATIPATTANQTGNLLDVVDWVADAYTELQTEQQSWRWLRSSFSLQTVASTFQYAYGDCTDSRLTGAIDRFSHWIIDDLMNPPKAYLTSGGIGSQYFLQYIDWDTFCAMYKIGTIQESPPVNITIDPQNKIQIGPTPNDIYTITGEYQMSPQVLAGDGDVPEMPSQFHLLIMYDAMRKYAGDQAAQEAMVRAVNEGGALRSRLLLNQLPMFQKGRPLA